MSSKCSRTLPFVLPLFACISIERVGPSLAERSQASSVKVFPPGSSIARPYSTVGYIEGWPWLDEEGAQEGGRRLGADAVLLRRYQRRADTVIDELRATALVWKDQPVDAGFSGL